MKNKMLKVLVVEPMQPCHVQEIPHTLEAMRDVVGGDIEAAFPFQEPVAVICSAQGKDLDLPYNRPLVDESGLPRDIVCGTFFIAGLDGEDFASLTAEQIQRYKSLYDNVVVLTAERSAAQAEIAPDAPMPNFAVSCQILFRVTREDQDIDAMKDAFADHVTGIFNSDEALAERTVGDLNFTFRGRCAEVRYTFARQDRDKAAAERFSEQCVRNVQGELEGYGCKIEKVECLAEELEPDRTRVPVKGQKNQDKKKGSRHER